MPTVYDKTSNALFLDPIPNYNATNGLKVWINREPSYFLYSDTTKKPGVPGLFHRYFAIKPAMEYARRKKLKSFVGLYNEVQSIEKDIVNYFSKRSRDESDILSGEPITFI